MDKVKDKAGRYILYFAFFILAGVFQWAAELTKDSLSLFFSVLSSAIFFALVIFWAFSVQRRMPNRRSRYLLSAISLLLLAFLVLRFVKYFLVEEANLSRYLRYSFYLPELFVPILIAILGSPRKRRKAFAAILSSIGLIFAALIFTNDLHEWFFAFKGGDMFGDNVERGWLFYVVTVYTIVLLLLCLLFLIYRCRKQGTRKFFLLPILVFALCLTFDVVSVLFSLPMYRIPELMCFTFLAIFESCIPISLIPSNDGYREYFASSSTKALIIDAENKLVAKSKGALLPSLAEREAALQGEIYLDGDLRLRSAKINGGYVLIEEDLSSLRELEKRLVESKEELEGEQDLLVYENEVKGKAAAIKEQKEIFKTIHQLSKALLPDISLCLLRAKEGDYAKNVSEALLRLAYLKRRANLLLKEEGSLPLDELSLCLKESLHYLPCPSSFESKGEGELSKKTILKIYEDFELVAEGLEGGLFLLLILRREEKGVSLRFFFSSKATLPPRLKGKRKESISEEGHLLELSYMEAKA